MSRMNGMSVRMARGGAMAILMAAAAWTGGCAAPSQSAATVDPGLVFNGVDLSGWDGDPRYWRVEEGCLTGETTEASPLARNTFIIYRGAEVGDFELEFDYVIRSERANSGVQYRSFELPAEHEDGRWIVGGYQADIDEPVTYTGIVYGERDRGILALRGQQVTIEPGGAAKVTGSLGEAGDLAKRINGRDGWNSYRVRMQGNRLSHTINGVTMTEAVDNDAVVTEPGAKGARSRGVIAFQLHTGPAMKIQFRNVRLRDLSGSEGR